MKKYNLYDIILMPVMSEKSNNLSASDNKYTFFVRKKSTKSDVAKALEFAFSVKVKNVNIINLKAEKVRFKGVMGKSASRKKAIVTLEDGHKIDLFGGA